MFNVETIKTLYYSLVRPKIMYGSCIWRPIFINSIDRLEKINHKFIRFLAFKSRSPLNTLDHSYSQNALKFKVSIINSSMNANDIIWLQKIIDHNQVKTGLIYIILFVFPPPCKARYINYKGIDPTFSFL